MAAAPDQPGLETLSGRKFSFYPAIRNIEHNEWSFERATWSEALVVNIEGGQEVWIPRNYLGSVSSADEPVLIVGLNRELEFKAGAVWPHRKTVIEMPAPRARRSSDPGKTPSAPAGGVPATSEAESKVGRFVGGALAIALAACLMLVAVVSEGFPNPLECSGRFPPRQPISATWDSTGRTDTTTRSSKSASPRRNNGSRARKRKSSFNCCGTPAAPTPS